MMDAVQDRVEGLGDIVEIAQGQFAIVQLPIGENAVDQPLYETLKARRRRIVKDPGSRFDNIGQQDRKSVV